MGLPAKQLVIDRARWHGAVFAICGCRLCGLMVMLGFDIGGGGGWWLLV